MNWIRQIWLLFQSVAAKTRQKGIKVTKPEDQKYRIEMIWISQIWLLFQALAAKTCPKINKVSAWPRNRPDRTGPDRSSRTRTGPDRAHPGQGANVDESSWARIIFSNQMSKQHPFNYQYMLRVLFVIGTRKYFWRRVLTCAFKNARKVGNNLPMYILFDTDIMAPFEDCLCLMLGATPHRLTLTFSCSREKNWSF